MAETETCLQYGRINFPLYAVTPLSCNHVIVGGGGGSSNTGVFDGFVSPPRWLKCCSKIRELNLF